MPFSNLAAPLAVELNARVMFSPGAYDRLRMFSLGNVLIGRGGFVLGQDTMKLVASA